MLNKIILFSVRNKLLIGFFILLWIMAGIYSFTRLAVDAVPDITNNQVQIITVAPTLASQEVEQFITYPIEQNLSNLPDLVEMRSISRFGLSVITLVFQDKVDIYFARQLIGERLRHAEDEIPEGMGKPELAPVSTGLGEIYQYLLHPRKGSEHKYSASDLRTLQDWVVARQLYGTPGVAEVNSFGGYLKQYEVAVDPYRLKSMNVSIPELMRALEKNNQNTGGAYIEKRSNAYFIRGIGLVQSLEDIGNIVIRNTGGVPVLVRHVATPRIGHALRYGAMTRNGEGEVVGGIVMMLKGANSAEVVKNVKERMENIRKSLPPDIEIEPFLDRTHLVDRAMATVEKNLIEGALIVIFVLVLFLGNLRAGLIVASAIPLSLLFAFSMMHVFGVSANLMSLGAVDFGLIVDGAVIVVEATLHHLGLRKTGVRLSQKEMDAEVFESASRIRTSAAFGEIIILIVYIPILTLTGIEGKMFRPMAQTVSFAILGALILSMTYIPMMCALFLPKKLNHKRTFSDKMMDFLHRKYEPVLKWALNRKVMVVSISGGLLLITITGFSRMGGEFIPQLQEGDYAFHCILPQGASLTQSVETSMQAERIIKSFPEVKEVVGKTGSAEIPTDPMPPEVSDLIIILKDKKEWTTTKDYNELAALMMEKLHQIPGVFFEANQPIQMRFNELMTGVRQDVAVKIFGENLDSLTALAARLRGEISKIPGITDPQIERTSGLPQIQVVYNRPQLAAYGLNIADINRLITSGFSGISSGVVYENERKFDLVVRLDSSFRNSIEDVSGLFIPLNDGSQIPLSQVASIAFKEGPAQISREDGKRRIVIGFNVQGRDVQSVVNDIQKQLSGFKMPTGYYYTFGGTFQHLEAASARLSMAVPAALLLIFLLLYLTFHSARQALLIFTAIPMSAIGGVFALWLRGMPFSVSAGVGFIALFGVAVLNGIVLIGYFNHLAKEGAVNLYERVLAGTQVRLRPVLMTATVASLGFLPMALSNGAGAEVQKPLATVVIGGLISATVLTLIVLPALYILFNEKKRKTTLRKSAFFLFLIICPAAFPAKGQQGKKYAERSVSFNELFEKALQNNPELKAGELIVRRNLALSRTVPDFPATGIFVENEDINPADEAGLLKIGISQTISFPTVYQARKNLLREQLEASVIQKNLRVLELEYRLRKAYYALCFQQHKAQLLEEMAAFYKEAEKVAVLRVKTGESAGLDSLSALAQTGEIRLQLREVHNEILKLQSVLKSLLNTDSFYLAKEKRLPKLEITSDFPAGIRSFSLPAQRQAVDIAAAEVRLSRTGWYPELSGRVFSQRWYQPENPYSGFSLTFGFPVLGANAQKNKIKAALLERDYQSALLETEQKRLGLELEKVLTVLKSAEANLDYYENQGLPLAEEIKKAAGLSYKGGIISFAAFSQYINQAMEIQKSHLDALNFFNANVIELNYLLKK